MTSHDKNLVLQACAFAREFIKEADRAAAGLPSETCHAAAQLRAALSALPPAIEGCSCGCAGFWAEVEDVITSLPSFESQVLHTNPKEKDVDQARTH